MDPRHTKIIKQKIIKHFLREGLRKGFDTEEGMDAFRKAVSYSLDLAWLERDKNDLAIQLAVIIRFSRMVCGDCAESPPHKRLKLSVIEDMAHRALQSTERESGRSCSNKTAVVERLVETAREEGWVEE